ncbi:MAG: peptidylprolyl isomerase [Oscillospiraceae bacterium]|nr:peptidylprolyl isomerase [Oscillospiraceae bacterium]
MSASREKKKRQETLTGGSPNPRAAREAQEKAAEKRSLALYTAGAVAFVILAVFLVIYNSGIIERNKTAVTIDGENYTVAQTAYYYQQAYQSFVNSTSGYYAVMFGQLDTSQSMKSQSYDETRTWDDYFKEEAVKQMQFTHAAKKAARDEGMSLEADDMTLYNDNLDSLKSSAKSAGYSYRTYLGLVYGATMTPSIYESCEKDRLLASKYATAHYDGISFSDGEIESYYNEHKDEYDLVDGAYVSISGYPETKTDDDGNVIEPTDEEKTAAMTEAKNTADEILAAYREGGNLETLANDHDVGYYASSEMSDNSSTYSDWLFDSSRKNGDTAVLEDESQYYVVLFNSRSRDEALDYSVRHILVTEDSLGLAEGEEAEEGQVLAKAEEIFAGWDGTEDGFASLAAEYSQDTGSKDNGGLYENTAKGAMISEFEDWCYEGGRRPGDTGIVETTYGQHIMYFVGYGDTQYWHYACESDMTADAYSTWYDETINSVAADVNTSNMDAIGV